MNQSASSSPMGLIISACMYMILIHGQIIDLSSIGSRQGLLANWEWKKHHQLSLLNSEFLGSQDLNCRRIIRTLGTSILPQFCKQLLVLSLHSIHPISPWMVPPGTIQISYHLPHPPPGLWHASSHPAGPSLPPPTHHSLGSTPCGTPENTHSPSRMPSGSYGDDFQEDPTAYPQSSPYHDDLQDPGNIMSTISFAHHLPLSHPISCAAPVSQSCSASL